MRCDEVNVYESRSGPFLQAGGNPESRSPYEARCERWDAARQALVAAQQFPAPRVRVAGGKTLMSLPSAFKRQYGLLSSQCTGLSVSCNCPAVAAPWLGRC